MSDPARDGDDSTEDSGHPHEPDEPTLPGENNPGERLIEKYDPTINDGGFPEDELAPDTEDVDVSPETARLFWYLVAVLNVGLMGVAVGLMLIGFQSRWALGGQITLAGAILLGYGYYRYRKHARSDDGRIDASSDQNG